MPVAGIASLFGFLAFIGYHADPANNGEKPETFLPYMVWMDASYEEVSPAELTSRYGSVIGGLMGMRALFPSGLVMKTKELSGLPFAPADPSLQKLIDDTWNSLEMEQEILILETRNVIDSFAEREETRCRDYCHCISKRYEATIRDKFPGKRTLRLFLNRAAEGVGSRIADRWDNHSVLFVETKKDHWAVSDPLLFHDTRLRSLAEWVEKVSPTTGKVHIRNVSASWGLPRPVPYSPPGVVQSAE